MRCQHRWTPRSYQACLAGLATASGVETITRKVWRDCREAAKTASQSGRDPNATVTMKDGRIASGAQAEHAVDMETERDCRVTLQVP